MPPSTTSIEDPHHRRTLTTPAVRGTTVAGALALVVTLLAPSSAWADTPADDPAESGGQAAEELEWQEITFGQSTDLDFSSNVLPEKVGVNHAVPDEPGTIDGEVFMESRGGKLAPGHDGLTFYHVTLDPNEHNFVLEAEVTVHQLGPETGASPNGQEGAGLMVRDLNGGPRQNPMLEGFEEVPAASNYASSTVLRQGPVGMTRTGVTEPWGTVGSERRATNLGGHGLTIDEPVTMRLERTDDSFVMSTTSTHLDEPETHTHQLDGADWVQDIEPDLMTVGFFASRNVAVTFSGASLTLSDADTQPRPEQPEPVTPVSFDLRAPEHSGSTSYPFAASAGHPGTVDVAVDGETVISGEPITAEEELTAQLDLPEGTSTVSSTYHPAEGPDLTPITRSVEVTVREFHDAPLMVSPDGTPDGEGTEQSPLDVHTAVQHVLPGQTVELLEGEYQPESTISLSPAYSGTVEEPKTLTAAEGAQVIVDGRSALQQIIRLDADHWVVSDLELTRSAGNGLRSSGSHNVVDSMVFSHNGNSGFQLSGGGAPEDWPAENLIVDSEAHDNRDPADINADGFAAKLGVGPGNVFRGNVAHHNIDDGWDLYNRTNEGPNFPITMEGNIAHHNGQLSDGYNAGSGIGTGFKVGGEGLPVDHVLTGNLAYANNLDGFSDNFNPGRLTLTNNTAVDNVRYNYIFRTNPYFEPEDQGIFRSNLSVHSGGDGRADQIAGDVDSSNVLFDGSRSQAEGGKRLVLPRDLVSIDPPGEYERDEDGSLIWGDFAKPTFRSILVDGGDDGGPIGAVEPAPHPGGQG
ncbi:right-handed parallel beta-helix repeat-containing protein [Nesterenkonia sp. HG001]|uniref:right-handed parallel beta-helix repeat-containing protein n=1 Tax=Nesterenkonia sp. HG001 TaxID=2983207 RepID=UPI002AC55BFD|nr:right-handed parallel beta-helix repeat-containing protein [Nesterenkonia sp. HG001]MDZ5076365.1 right-handed parallel beta-helix repeat-containing protein [Nesterenkonia sp. HG001]